MREFSIGDKVVVKRAHSVDCGHYYNIGASGVVSAPPCESGEGRLFVHFETGEFKHNHLTEGHGWWALPEELGLAFDELVLEARDNYRRKRHGST